MEMESRMKHSNAALQLLKTLLQLLSINAFMKTHPKCFNAARGIPPKKGRINIHQITGEEVL